MAVSFGDIRDFDLNKDRRMNAETQAPMALEEFIGLTQLDFTAIK
jgi:hypothetical protein